MELIYIYVITAGGEVPAQNIEPVVCCGLLQDYRFVIQEMGMFSIQSGEGIFCKIQEPEAILYHNRNEIPMVVYSRRL